MHFSKVDLPDPLLPCKTRMSPSKQSINQQLDRMVFALDENKPSFRVREMSEKMFEPFSR
jgi:hypothetical protein